MGSVFLCQFGIDQQFIFSGILLNPQINWVSLEEENLSIFTCIWNENHENSQMKMFLLRWVCPLQQTNEKENYVLEREQVIFADDGS